MATTSFDLTVNARTWGKGTVTHVAGQRALGFYRLMLQLTINVHPLSDGIQYKLTGFSGDTTAQNRLLGSLLVTAHMFPLTAQAGWVSSQTLGLYIDLDRARLEALEEVRAGGDLQVSMQYAQGDPHASARAVLKVVDADNPPLRVFFGDGPLSIATQDYEQRLATWRK
jgi:hypothetical protein